MINECRVDVGLVAELHELAFVDCVILGFQGKLNGLLFLYGKILVVLSEAFIIACKQTSSTLVINECVKLLFLLLVLKLPIFFSLAYVVYHI